MPNPLGSRGQLANLDPNIILDRIQSGESLRTIAADIGVSNVGLRAWLLRCDDERYHQVIVAGLTARVAETDAMLEDAQDMISVARASHLARYARWDAERRLPALFGAKQQITHEHRTVRDLEGEVIDRQIEAIEASIQQSDVSE